MGTKFKSWEAVGKMLNSQEVLLVLYFFFVFYESSKRVMLIQM